VLVESVLIFIRFSKELTVATNRKVNVFQVQSGC
jgi:hypothetical protein